MPSRTVTRANGTQELMAAQKFDLVARPVDAKLMRAVITDTRTRARQPEKWFDDIGEIHYGITRSARIAGYAHINAYIVGKDGKPGKMATQGPAYNIASMFSSPYGGQRGLIERFVTLMKVPGDCYLIRCREGNEVVGYDVVGASELETDSIEGVGTGGMNPNTEIRRVVLPSQRAGGEIQYVPIEPRDFLGRVWRPAIKYIQVADSPMAALDTQCEILHLLTLGLKGKLLSRLALNGILYIPNEINDIRSGQPTGKENEVLDNKTFSKLVQAATWAIRNFEDPASALPIFASGPAQYADAIKHIILDREIYQTDMALRAEMIDRILTGLDVQKAQTQSNGHQNHWSSWSNTDDELRVNIRPDLETFMWAATRLVLNREMEEQNIAAKTVDRYMFWYDLADAATTVNAAEDARQAYDRILIGGDAGRRVMNFGDGDKPEGDELVRMVGQKVNNPYLALYGTDEWKVIDWDKVAAVGSTKAGPNEATPADKPEASPGNQPGKPGGKSESDTPTRLKPAS